MFTRWRLRWNKNENILTYSCPTTQVSLLGLSVIGSYYRFSRRRYVQYVIIWGHIKIVLIIGCGCQVHCCMWCGEKETTVYSPQGGDSGPLFPPVIDRECVCVPMHASDSLTMCVSVHVSGCLCTSVCARVWVCPHQWLCGACIVCMLHLFGGMFTLWMGEHSRTRHCHRLPCNLHDHNEPHRQNNRRRK